MERKTHSAEEKVAAVSRIARGEVTVSGLAREMGVCRATMCNWMKLYRQQGGNVKYRSIGRPRVPKVADLLAENEALKQENERLKAQAASN